MGRCKEQMRTRMIEYVGTGKVEDEKGSWKGKTGESE